MQPKIIKKVIQQTDLVGDLLQRRAQQLQLRYPEFRQDFSRLQQKLKQNSQIFKARREEEGQDQLYRKVLEQLELKEYRLIKNIPKFNIKCNRRTQERHINKKEEEVQRPQPSQSQRNSEISQTGFKPYHISNFKRSLQNFHINLMNQPRKNVKQAN